MSSFNDEDLVEGFRNMIPQTSKACQLYNKVKDRKFNSMIK